MGRLDTIRTELDAGHPDTGAYNVDDALAAGEMNVVNRSRNIAELTGSQVLNAVDKVEFSALDATDKQQVWDIVHLGTVNPFGIEADLFIDIFGGGSDTIISLQALRREAVSRGVELGVGFVGHSDVEDARKL